MENKNKSESVLSVLDCETERTQGTLNNQNFRFSDRLKDIIGENSARSFANRADLSQTVIRRYLENDSTPNIDRLIAIAKVGGVTVQWLATGQGPKFQQDLDSLLKQEPTSAASQQVAPQQSNEDFLSEFALVPGYNIQVSAGFGSEGSDTAEPTRHLAFRKRWLKYRGFCAKDLVIVWAKGDSMEPAISNNNSLLINTAQKQLSDGHIYVLRSDNQLWVKRVQVRPNSCVLLSDNPQYPPFEVAMTELQNFEVIGQVVHIARDVGT